MVRFIVLSLMLDDAIYNFSLKCIVLWIIHLILMKLRSKVN